MPPEVAIYRPTIIREAQFRFGIPAPLALFAGQIAQESGYDPSAKSRVGAAGLLQFMPATASWAGQQLGGPAAPLDPHWSIRAGVWYIKWLYDRVSYPTECARFGAALSAYNGGLGWHNKRKAAAADPMDFWGSVRLVNPGISLSNQAENEQYPYRIIFKHQARFREIGGRLVCIK